MSILFTSGNKLLGHFGFNWNFAYCKDMVASSEKVMETKASKWLQNYEECLQKS